MILKENSYFAQNGVNESSVRTESPLLLRTCFIQEKEFKFQTRIGE